MCSRAASGSGSRSSSSAIVAGALGTAYLIVVPSLERRLVDARLEQLEEARRPARGDLPGTRFEWPDRRAVRTRDERAGRGVRRPLEDRRRSRVGCRLGPRASRDVARRASRCARSTTGEVERGRVVSDMQDYADVAVPLGEDAMLLFRAPLADSLATVRLVEQRLLLATASRSRSHSSSGSPPPGCSRTGFASGDRRGAHRGRRLRRTDRRPRRRRDRRACARLRPHARPARAARQRAKGVRRQRVARAADADLLARRVPRAARRRGARRRDPRRVPRDDAGAGRAPREALDRPARPLARRRGPAPRRRGARRSRPRSCSARRRARAHGCVSGHVLEADVEGDAWVLGDEERVAPDRPRALVECTRCTRRPARRSPWTRAARRPGRARRWTTTARGSRRAQREAVFERFYRVEGGMASGSGLGLAIARELARLMGGSVRLESAPRPTVFTLDLPRSSRRPRTRAGRRFHVKTRRAPARVRGPEKPRAVYDLAV